MIKFIYFDMGGVLLSYDFSKTAKAITAKTGLNGEKVIDDLYINYIDQWNDFELGAVSPEDFFALFHLPMSFDDLKKAYNEIFTLKKDTGSGSEQAADDGNGHRRAETWVCRAQPQRDGHHPRAHGDGGHDDWAGTFVAGVKDGFGAR